MLLISLTPQVISSNSFENNPPFIPSNPSPQNGAIDVDIEADLSWVGGDPDENNTVTYDIYFGESNPPPLVASNQTETTYDQGTMSYLTTFYWQIISWDNESASSQGPIWSFTTIQQPNQPPYLPNNPYPANGASDILIEIILTWSGGDPDGDTVTYDVYFGDITPPPKITSNQTITSYYPGTLDFGTTYYWQIISWDQYGATTPGQIWNFNTRTNNPPNTPNDPRPINGAVNVDINTDLKWSGGDPDGDNVRYDVYFGTTTPPPLVVSNYISTTFNPGIMEYYTTYYWQIVSFDEYNSSSQSIIWSFTTQEDTNRAPVRPNIDGLRALLVPNHDYEYTFVTTDPDDDDVFYYVDWGDGTFEDWFGPVSSNVNATKIHAWPKATKIYEIQVKAKDIYGAESDWGKMYVIVVGIKSATRPVFGMFILKIIDRFPILQKMMTLVPLISRMINLR